MSKTIVTSLFAFLLVSGTALHAVTLIDDTFGDGNPETNTDGTVAPGVDGTYYAVNSQGALAGEVTEAGGAVTLDPADDNWARAELLSKNDFAFPAVGTSKTISWTIGPITPVTDNDGEDYRIQFSANNAARSQEDPGNPGFGRDAERWVLDGPANGDAAISLDMFFDPSIPSETNTSTWEKNSTIGASNDGTNTGIGSNLAGWDWTTQSNTISLKLTSVDYTWSESATGWSSGAIAYEPTLLADMAGGFWAYTHGQNRDSGRGSHQLTAFSVTEIPEPATAGLALLAVAGMYFGRRR